MNFHIISIFPEVFLEYFQVGVLGRAIKNKKINLNLYNLRDYSKNKHRKVDDISYGGGPGMVMAIQPIFDCLENIKSKIKKDNSKILKDEIRVVLLSAKGQRFNQEKALKYKKIKHLILICGRYEGVDERVADYLADEEISIGEYVLSGGELPALIVVDSVSRLIPGVLGNCESLKSESYNEMDAKSDFPVYTKPEKFKEWEVPKVLLSGNHGEIEKWRRKKRS
jgi:tRNA (guanine37-N1)-methyltransferase